MPIASLIVPIKKDYGERDYLWSLIEKRHKELIPEVEIVIGENNDELFNRSKAINDAVTRAKTDILILCDSDSYFRKDLIYTIIKYLDTSPWTIPFKKAYRLSPDTTKVFIQRGLPERVQLNIHHCIKIDDCPGMILNAMKKSAFETIGGMDERFCGWGYEDLAMVCALDTLVGKHTRIPGGVYHLYHEPAKYDHPHYLENQALYNKYKEAYGDKKKMLNIIH